MIERLDATDQGLMLPTDRAAAPGVTPRCSASNRLRQSAIRCRWLSSRASIARSHSVSRPTDRFQIRRADAYLFIINDENFAWTSTRKALALLYDGILDAKSMVPISLVNVADEAIAIGAHHETLQQPRRRSPYDCNHFGPLAALRSGRPAVTAGVEHWSRNKVGRSVLIGRCEEDLPEG